MTRCPTHGEPSEGNDCPSCSAALHSNRQQAPAGGTDPSATAPNIKGGFRPVGPAAPTIPRAGVPAVAPAPAATQAPAQTNQAPAQPQAPATAQAVVPIAVPVPVAPAAPFAPVAVPQAVAVPAPVAPVPIAAPVARAVRCVHCGALAQTTLEPGDSFQCPACAAVYTLRKDQVVDLSGVAPTVATPGAVAYAAPAGIVPGVVPQPQATMAPPNTGYGVGGVAPGTAAFAVQAAQAPVPLGDTAPAMAPAASAPPAAPDAAPIDPAERAALERARQVYDQKLKTPGGTAKGKAPTRGRARSSRIARKSGKIRRGTISSRTTRRKKDAPVAPGAGALVGAAPEPGPDGTGAVSAGGPTDPGAVARSSAKTRNVSSAKIRAANAPPPSGGSTTRNLSLAIIVLGVLIGVAMLLRKNLREPPPAPAPDGGTEAIASPDDLLEIKSLENAAAAGDAQAMLSLGTLYTRAPATREKLDKARGWLEKAVEASDAKIRKEAKRLLGEVALLESKLAPDERGASGAGAGSADAGRERILSILAEAADLAEPPATAARVAKADRLIEKAIADPAWKPALKPTVDEVRKRLTKARAAVLATQATELAGAGDHAGALAKIEALERTGRPIPSGVVELKRRCEEALGRGGGSTSEPPTDGDAGGGAGPDGGTGGSSDGGDRPDAGGSAPTGSGGAGDTGADAGGSASAPPTPPAPARPVGEAIAAIEDMQVRRLDEGPTEAWQNDYQALRARLTGSRVRGAGEIVEVGGPEIKPLVTIASNEIWIKVQLPEDPRGGAAYRGLERGAKVTFEGSIRFWQPARKSLRLTIDGTVELER